MQDTHHGTIQQRLDALEAKLDDELSKEASTREADVYELKELIGGEALVREAHHSSVQELIAGEKAEREAHLDKFHGTMAVEKDAREDQSLFISHSSKDNRHFV